MYDIGNRMCLVTKKKDMYLSLLLNSFTNCKSPPTPFRISSRVFCERSSALARQLLLSEERCSEMFSIEGMNVVMLFANKGLYKYLGLGAFHGIN